MEKILFTLSVAALMACSNSGVASGTVIDQPTSSNSNGSSSNSNGSSSNSTSNDGFLRGVWLHGEPEIDDGDVYNAYYCFANNGETYWIADDDLVDGKYVYLYSGDYSISGKTLNVNYDTRASFVGDAGATPTDASTWSSESLDGDEVTSSITYTTSGTTMVMTSELSDSTTFTTTFTLTTSVPAYVKNIPCQ